MPWSSSAVSLPAPGRGRSITYFGMGTPFLLSWYGASVPTVCMSHTVGRIQTSQRYVVNRRFRHPMTTIPRSVRATAKSTRAAATREALLAAARDLFGTQGFANTSVDEVVRRAGMTKGALYHHFKDKDELFRAVVEEVKLEVTQTAASRYFETNESPDPIEAVRLTCFAVIDAYLDPAVQRIAVLDARSVLGAAVRRDLDNR